MPKMEVKCQINFIFFRVQDLILYTKRDSKIDWKNSLLFQLSSKRLGEERRYAFLKDKQEHDGLITRSSLSRPAPV